MNRPLLTLAACVTLALGAGGYVYLHLTPAPEAAPVVKDTPVPVIPATPVLQPSPAYQVHFDAARRAGARQVTSDCSDLFTNALTQRLWRDTPALDEACFRLPPGFTPDMLREVASTNTTVTARGVTGNATILVLADPGFTDQALLVMVEDAGGSDPVMGLALVKTTPAALALAVGLPFPEAKPDKAAPQSPVNAPEKPEAAPEPQAEGALPQAEGALPQALNADRVAAFCGEYHCATVDNGAGPYALTFVTPQGVKGAITADPDGAVLFLFGVSDARTQQPVLNAFDRSVSGRSGLMDLAAQCAPIGETLARVKDQAFDVTCASGLQDTPPALPGAQAPWVEYGVRVAD